MAKGGLRDPKFEVTNHGTVPSVEASDPLENHSQLAHFDARF